MALTPQTIEVYRGEQALISFTMNPVEDITGWTLMFTVTREENKETKLIGPLSMNILVPANGTFEIELAEENTDITPGEYVFDVWRVDEAFEEVKAIGSFIVLGNSRVPPI